MLVQMELFKDAESIKQQRKLLVELIELKTREIQEKEFHKTFTVLLSNWLRNLC